MNATELWNLILHLAPVVLALIMAVIKIGRMFDEKLGEQGRSFTSAVGKVEEQVSRAIGELWASQTRQDVRFDALSRDHYRLEGRLGVKNETGPQA